jgi:peptide/nickel transport system substrate-binding protein
MEITRCTELRWRAQIRRTTHFVVVALLATAEARSSVRPQYGGTLRIELRSSALTLNPQRWKAGSSDYATNQRLAELVFDRLVSLDNYGRFQPQLATEWSHDAGAKRWQFTLRQGVMFSDGKSLAPADVVAALQPVLPKGMQITAAGGGVTIQCANPTSDLLELLASGPLFVYRADGKGAMLGTGPFVLESSPAGAQQAEKGSSDGAATSSQRVRFRFNELCWSGRPYLNAVEVTMNVPPSRALLDLQLGKTDLAELSEDTARRAQQSNVKVWVSLPLTLYAVKFAAPANSPGERGFREALSLSVNREAMARVLLQKQASPAQSFLPQWLSGYAFLFEMESNLERAKELRASLPLSVPGTAQPLRVAMDASNDLSKLIAERVAVNARAAGITMQIVQRIAVRSAGDGAATKSDADTQLIAWRYTSLSPRDALETLAVASRWKLPEAGVPSDDDARYAWEKRMMDEKNLLPLVAVPDFAALDPRVRNWSPAPWGEWRLADVWLDQPDAAGPLGDTPAKSPAGARP